VPEVLEWQRSRRPPRVAAVVPDVPGPLDDLIDNLLAKATADRAEAATLMALGKIAMSRILHETARVQTEIVGPESMLSGPDSAIGDAVTFRTLNAYFTSIGGGTDQIQRNIVGERVLGLPREPEPFKDTPFRDLPTGS
jgi:alkylation response protein AidB-like acyl-CoA dehydrogenase